MLGATAACLAVVGAVNAVVDPFQQYRLATAPRFYKLHHRWINPGIAKRALPAALVADLPRRSGVQITIFGDRIVLLEASGLVVDVLENVFQ